MVGLFTGLTKHLWKIRLVQKLLGVCMCVLKYTLPLTHTEKYPHSKHARTQHTHNFACMKIQVYSLVCRCTPCTSAHSHSKRRAHHTQTNTHLRLWVSHCTAQQGLGSWGFPHREKQVTSAQLPYKSMYSTATSSCSVCSKTSKYTGKKNLLYYVCERERERKTLRNWGESSQRSLK